MNYAKRKLFILWFGLKLVYLTVYKYMIRHNLIFFKKKLKKEKKRKVLTLTSGTPSDVPTFNHDYEIDPLHFMLFRFLPAFQASL